MVLRGSFFLLFFCSWLSVGHSQFIPFSAWNTAARLVFATAPLTFITKTCSPGITVRSSLGGTSQNYIVPANKTINITSHAGLTLYSDQYCSQVITNPVILAGQSQVTFYLIHQNAETINLEATHTEFEWHDKNKQDATFTNTNFLWTGGANPDATWSTGGNWSGGVAPGTSDVAIFDNTCATNCSPITTGAVDIGGLRMETGYAGTINQGPFNFQVRVGHFVQLAGTFAGDATTTGSLLAMYDGGMIMDGGTMTFPSFETKVSGNYRAGSGATITVPTNSTLYYWCVISMACHNVVRTMDPGTVAYENVYFSGARSRLDFLGSTWTVNKNLTTGDTVSRYSINNGTFNLYGNLSTHSLGSDGTALIILKGNATGQTISGDGGNDDHFPRVHIEAGANPVTISGYVTVGDWVLTSTSGLTTTGSTLNLYCSDQPWCYNVVDSTFDLGSATYNNLIITGNRLYINLQGNTWHVDGDLTMGDLVYQTSHINNGRIQLKGNLTLKDDGYEGSAIIELIGNASGQTISPGTSTDRLLPQIEINTGSHPVTVTGHIKPANWTYTSSGTMTLTGSTIELSKIHAGHYGAGMTIDPTFGSIAYNNLTISGYNTNWDLTGETVIVNGTFSFGDVINDVFGSTNLLIGGTIEAYGDVSEILYGYKGSTLINVKGNILGQTVTGLGGYYPALQIDAGSNNVTLVGDLDLEDYTFLSAGVFNPTTSAVRFVCKNGFACDNTTLSPIFGSVTYYDVFFAGYKTNWDFGGQTVYLSNTLTLYDQSTDGKLFNNGTFKVGGTVDLDNDRYVRGNAVIELTGRPAGQAIQCGGSSASAPDRTPVLKLNSGTNPVTLAGNCAPDGWQYVSSGSFTGLTASKLYLQPDASHPWTNASVTLDFGSAASFYVLSFEGRNTNFDLAGRTITVTNGLALGDITSTGKTINNGTINLRGDYFNGDNGQVGNLVVNFTGSANQNVDPRGLAHPSGNITINKSAGIITLISNWNITNAGQDLTITDGDIDMAGFNLQVNDILTLNTGTSITQNLGTLTYGTLVNNGTINP